MLIVREGLRQTLAAHDEEREMIDDTRPAEAIHGVMLPRFPPVIVGGMQHPLLSLQRVSKRNHRRPRMATRHRVRALGENVRCGHEHHLLPLQTRKDAGSGLVPLIPLTPQRDQTYRVEKDWPQG